MTLPERPRTDCLSSKREKERRSRTWKTVTPITYFPPARHRLLLLLLPPLAAPRRRVKAAATVTAVARLAALEHSTMMVITRLTSQ